MTDVILLAIEPRLLAVGEMAAMPRRHAPLLRADAVIGAMQAGGLRMGHFAFSHFLMDASVLVGEAIVDFLAPRVLRLPGRIGQGRGRKARQRDGRGDGGEDGADRFRHIEAPVGTIAGVALRPIPGPSGVNNVAMRRLLTPITKS